MGLRGPKPGSAAARRAGARIKRLNADPDFRARAIDAARAGCARRHGVPPGLRRTYEKFRNKLGADLARAEIRKITGAAP